MLSLGVDPDCITASAHCNDPSGCSPATGWLLMKLITELNKGVQDFVLENELSPVPLNTSHALPVGGL